MWGGVAEGNGANAGQGASGTRQAEDKTEKTLVRSTRFLCVDWQIRGAVNVVCIGPVALPKYVETMGV